MLAQMENPMLSPPLPLPPHWCSHNAVKRTMFLEDIGTLTHVRIVSQNAP